MSYSTREAGVVHKRSLAQLVALVFGVVYVIVAALGFLLEEKGLLLDIFGINALHNFVHLGIGVALLAASTKANAARTACLIIGVTYLAFGVLGLVAKDFMDDLINNNNADVALHLASGAVLTFAALAKTHTNVDTTTRDRGVTTTR